MNCGCSILSPFRWREHDEHSIFANDPAFRAASTTGASRGQTATTALMKFEQETGRSRGTISYLAIPEYGDSIAVRRMREKQEKQARRRAA